MEKQSDFDLIKKKAGLLKALSNPVRLCIVRELLERGACSVGEMQNCLELSQSTVSQHLGRLRDLGLISGDRRKTSVFYRVSSAEAAEIVRILFRPDGL